MPRTTHRTLGARGDLWMRLRMGCGESLGRDSRSRAEHGCEYEQSDFIINTGNARASDIDRPIMHLRHKVERQIGGLLVPEIRTIHGEFM